MDTTDRDWRAAAAALGLGPPPARPPGRYFADAFDRYADHFDDHLRGDLAYRGPELLHAAVTRALAGATSLDVLDAGCGTGLAAPLFRPLARRLDGVDLS